MRKILSIVFSLLIAAVAVAQSDAPKYPQPFVGVGLSINGSGYSSVSLTGQAGLDLEENHFVSYTAATYDTARKTADNEIANEKGHVVSGQSQAFARFGSGYLLGGGAEWTKTITSDYTKEATYPLVGGGKDFAKFRLVLSYFREHNEITHYPTLVTFTEPGGTAAYRSQSCNCGSGVQGVTTQLWLPSPVSAHHLFFHAELKAYSYHNTLTDPYNAALTAAEKSVRSFGGELQYSVLYRF